MTQTFAKKTGVRKFQTAKAFACGPNSGIFLCGAQLPIAWNPGLLVARNTERLVKTLLGVHAQILFHPWPHSPAPTHETTLRAHGPAE